MNFIIALNNFEIAKLLISKGASVNPSRNLIRYLKEIS